MDSTDFSLILDAGGFSKGYGATAQLQTEFLLQGMSMLNYDCINLAVKDLSEGGDFLKSMRQKHGLNFLSSNIVYSQNNSEFVETFLIKKISADNSHTMPFNKLTVGFIGLCDEKESLLHKGREEAPLKSYNPIEAAKNNLANIRKKVDLVVLIFNGRFNTLEALLSQVTGIDIVIMGGEYYRAEQYSSQNVIVASTPSLGKYFGILTLELNKDKKIISSQKRRIPLDENIKDDPKFVKLVADFEKAQNSTTAVPTNSASE